MSVVTETITDSGLWSPPANVIGNVGDVDIVDGGGGGGGGFGGGLGGGGGAGGGGRRLAGYALTANMAVVIGAGGAGGIPDGSGGGLSSFDGQGTGSAGAAPGGEGTAGDGSGQASPYKGGSGSLAPYNGGGAANPAAGSDGGQAAGTGARGDGGTGDPYLGPGPGDGVGGYVAITYTLLDPPPTPGNLAATANLVHHIPVSWDAAAGATAYRLYREDDGYTTPIFDGAGTSYDDTGLGDSITHMYKVTAYNTAGESAQSASVSATTHAGVTVPGVSSRRIPHGNYHPWLS